MFDSIPNSALIVLTVIGIALLIIAIILILKYLDGNFKYEDEIIETREYKVISTDWANNKSVDYVQRILIKRTYLSGKIKIITKEVKV
jgi:hypothetical protein